MCSGIISKNEPLKQIKSYLDNFKNTLFLNSLFDLIKKKKLLEIVKLNKKLQKIMNLSIKDYQKYSESYSSIELELKLKNSSFRKNFTKILGKEEKYYHIYFDDSKEEIKRNYLKENEKVDTIKIIIDYQVTSFKELFNSCEIISSINFKKFYRANITDMSYMFNDCSSLIEFKSSNFNTNNVTNMSFMFNGCIALKELNLSNFNNNNLTNMSFMFTQCESLKVINFSNFNTNNVTNMEGMFMGCVSLIELDLSSFNTNNVASMSGMFADCLSLKELNLSSFNISNATGTSDMFDGCSQELKKKIKEKYSTINFGEKSGLTRSPK